MKSFNVVFAFLVFACGSVVPAAAATFPADANTTCPVMLDEEADPDIYVEHEGEKVYLCCTKCKREWKKDPAKYLARLKELKSAAGTRPKTSRDDGKSTAPAGSARK